MAKKVAEDGLIVEDDLAVVKADMLATAQAHWLRKRFRAENRAFVVMVENAESIEELMDHQNGEIEVSTVGGDDA